MSRNPAWPTTPLDAVEAAFVALTRPPEPLTLDLGQHAVDAGLPCGLIELPALRQWLLEQRTCYRARDVAWRELIRRARADGPAWVVATTAMALPALRRSVRQLRSGFTGPGYDLEAEVLAGFLTALKDRVDPDRPAPYAALCRAGWRAGRDLRLREGSGPVPVEDVELLTGSRTPQRPYGHPDLLVRRACVLGLIDKQDEDAYVDLRLGRRAIAPIAEQLGITVDALRMRAKRIDQRLIEAVRQGVLTDTAPHDLWAR